MIPWLTFARWPVTLWSLARRRNALRDLAAIRELRPDERLELASHDSRFGRLLMTTALVTTSGLAAWGWASGAVARARVHGLENDLAAARVETHQRTVERDEARDVARQLNAGLEAERKVRGECQAKWETSQAMCARVIGDGARRSETRIRRDAARRRGAVDAITKPPVTVGDPAPAPIVDPRSLLLAIQASPDPDAPVPGVPPAAAPGDGAGDVPAGDGAGPGTAEPR